MIDIRIRRQTPAEELGLTRSEAEMLYLLMSEDRWWKTRELWREINTDAGPEVIKVFAFRLKRKIDPENPSAAIQGKVKSGYRLTPEGRARLLNWGKQPANEAA